MVPLLECVPTLAQRPTPQLCTPPGSVHTTVVPQVWEEEIMPLLTLLLISSPWRLQRLSLFSAGSLNHQSVIHIANNSPYWRFLSQAKCQVLSVLSKSSGSSAGTPGLQVPELVGRCLSKNEEHWGVCDGTG